MKLLIVVTSLFATAGFAADSAKITKVNLQTWPSKHPTAIEEAVSLTQVGTFRFMRRDASEEKSAEIAVRWSASSDTPLTNIILRLEYRQTEHIAPRVTELKFPTLSRGARWSRFTLKGADYEKGGAVFAWRLSVWRDGKEVGSKHSVMWSESKPSAGTSQ